MFFVFDFFVKPEGMLLRITSSNSVYNIKIEIDKKKILKFIDKLENSRKNIIYSRLNNNFKIIHPHNSPTRRLGFTSKSCEKYVNYSLQDRPLLSLHHYQYINLNSGIATGLVNVLKIDSFNGKLAATPPASTIPEDFFSQSNINSFSK